jgi:type II secretory pathway component GspD/PulD (secretin)
MRNRLVGALALFTVFLTVPGALAQERTPDKIKRIIYTVQNGDAKDLAETLSKHFKAETALQFVPDANSNCLLITARPDALEDVFRVLQVLDHQPRVVTLEVIIAGVAAANGAEDKTESNRKNLDEKDLSGPDREVVAKIQELQKKGVLGILQRVRLTTLENHQTSATVMENKPYVTGSTRTGRGMSLNTISYRTVGTTVRLTPRVTDNGKILLTIRVEDARTHTPKEGVKLGDGDKGNTPTASEFITATLNTSLLIPSGQAVLAKGVKVRSRSRNAHTVVIVTARLEGPRAKTTKAK